MTYNYSKLKGQITEHYGTQRAFAEAICRNNAYVSQVLNSKAFLSQEEIDKWAEALDIGLSDYGVYFFTHQVCETVTEAEEEQ